MIYNVEKIASYIVEYSCEIKSPVSNLKLQKLLYYVQAYFLVNKNEPCFKEEIEHWRHGPVVRDVYSKYKIYFDDKITTNKEYINLKNYDRNLINRVVNSYKSYSSWDMVKKTHQEEPWLSTDCDEIIYKHEIKRYFNKHRNSILG